LRVNEQHSLQKFKQMVQEEEARIATEEINVLIDSMAARVTEVLSARGKSTFLVLKQRRSSSERGGGGMIFGTWDCIRKSFNSSLTPIPAI
jgi:hypothetical protein